MIFDKQWMKSGKKWKIVDKKTKRAAKKERRKGDLCFVGFMSTKLTRKGAPASPRK
jgi:hypothetical protein